MAITSSMLPGTPLPPEPARRRAAPRRLALAALVGLAGLTAPAWGQDPRAIHEDDLGSVRFRASCAEAVQADFDRAVALLHHMMYGEARAAFRAIAERDPSCAMAHWGFATTLFQPLWPARPGPDALRQGWEAVQRAKEIGARTERERALLAATEAFFRDRETADWWTRIRRWAEAMEAAHREHPDDIETSAFYALSVLAAGQVAGDRMARQAHAAEVLAGVLEREPRHPGAVHYTIHANDVDGRAGESLDVVRSYDGIAPSVPHALHMPTHIFVRLGEWPAVIEWNRKSADAALRFPAGDAVSFHYLHAMDYLVYAHLQRGYDEAARSAMEEALGRGPHQEDFAAAFHLASIPARWTVERRAWAEAAALSPRSPEYLAWDRYQWPEAITWFARGLGAAEAGDLEAARRAEARMRELRDVAAAAGERGFETYIEVDRLVLAGRIAHAEGDAEAAVARTREAAELERTVQKHPITPGALLPPYEALGDLLADLDRPAEAVEAYEASLAVWPGRYNSLLGAARAALAAGDPQEAGAFYGALLEVVGDARSDRPGVREARERARPGG